MSAGGLRKELEADAAGRRTEPKALIEGPGLDGPIVTTAREVFFWWFIDFEVMQKSGRDQKDAGFRDEHNGTLGSPGSPRSYSQI